MEYTFVSLMVGVFQIYVLSRFMGIFFDRSQVNKQWELLSYIGYYIVSNAIYIVLDIPLITMISNLVLMWCLTLNYKATMKQRFLSVLFIYAILMLTESLVVVLSGYLHIAALSKMNYSSIWGFILIQVITYIEALIISNWKKLRKGISIPTSYWISIFFIPVSALYIILMILSSGHFSFVQLIVSIFLLLFIISIAFYLYDAITQTFEERMERSLLQQQNNFYLKQFELMEASLKQSRGIKHDMKNHLLVLKSLAKEAEEEKLLSYIDEIYAANQIQGEYAQSGNMVFDSILNFKLQEAAQKHIRTSLELIIPPHMNIAAFDITIVLGNLIDNAIHGASRAPEDKRIDIVIKYDRGLLVIRMENTFDGTVVYAEDKIATREEDGVNHGIGLENVRQVIAKYDGTLEIKHKDNHFSVVSLMYVEE